MGLVNRTYLSSELISRVLDRLPNGKRGAITASAEEICVAGIESDDGSFRWRLFDRLSEISKNDDDHFFLVDSRPERFLINLKDKFGPSKGLFVLKRQTEFSKVELAFELLNASHAPFQVIMDVGANIGTICIPAVARNMCDRAVAIEPHPTNCRLLRANLALNGVQDRVEVLEAAAGPIDGEELQLEVSDSNWGDHRISVSQNVVQKAASSKQIGVKSISLDTAIGELGGARAVVWMDVQGYEGHVLAGAKELLRHRTPVVLEFDPHIIEQAKSFEPLLDATANYDGFYNLNDRKIFRPVSELTAFRDELAKRKSFTDILLV